MPIKRSYADHGDACATAHAFDLLGDRWTYPILRELMLGPKRFVELAETVRGVTPAVLSGRLREMEVAGLVRRVEMTSPARGTGYAASAWALELRDVFRRLGRWAQSSPTWATDGGGLTPDAAIQSMETMAPGFVMTPPVVVGLWLRDARIPGASATGYRLRWGGDLSITRDATSDVGVDAVVRADSTTWVSVLYDGTPLTDVEVSGDEDAVRRLVGAFAR